MKPSILFGAEILLGLMLGLSSCATRDSSLATRVPIYQGPANPSVSQVPLVTVGPALESGWPLTLVNGTTNFIVYQPQIDMWDRHLLVARSAVAIQSGSQVLPVYGVITINAMTLIDKSQRSVSLEDPKIVSADFPSDRQQTDQYLRMLRERIPKEIRGLSLDDLKGSLTLTPEDLTGSGQPLNNTPPQIIVSTQPAVLVSIDGAPAYRPVPGTDLQRVINTRLLLLKDQTGAHYLRLLDHQYLKAPTLEGPWTASRQAPTGATQAEKTSSTAVPLDPLEASAGPQDDQALSFTNGAVPVIYVVTKPTELITFDGHPNFVPLSDTHLLYAENTTANVFELLTDQRTYLLLAGRWFSAPSLKGPWQFVPGSQLPTDFANIPDSSPKENVKASVPGTTQATAALIANSIPQVGRVARTTPMQDPRIDGSPQLKPIEGTPLSYVVNSGTPIIKVADQSWYACQNGVWFTGASISGPWVVAASVPAVIYTIPVSSPLHYLTYVGVYGATPDAVYDGYTPGYLGTEVSPDGVVVYGTGYPFAPWIGDEWYGGPDTWGLGWGPCWTPWDDWGFGFGYGWGCGFGRFGWWRCHPPVPGWGPYRHWHDSGGLAGHGWRRDGWVNTSSRLYARSSFRDATTGRGLANTPMASPHGRAYNSRTGGLVAGQRGDLPNVSQALRTATGGSSLWNSRALTSPGGAAPWENRPTANGTYPLGRQGLGFEPASRFGDNGSAGRVQSDSHAFSHGPDYQNSIRTGGAFGNRGSFSYGGEAFGFPRGGGNGGGGLGFSHGSGVGGFGHGGFSHGGGGGGFSHGGGGGGGHGGGGGGHGGGGR